MTETMDGVKRITADEATIHQQVGAAVIPLATVEDTGGRYSLFEVRDDPDSGPPMHRHTREDEAFYILEGEYEHYGVEGLEFRAGPGTYIHVKAGTVQAYKCVSPGGGRMLVVASPGGLETFFAPLAEAGSDFGKVSAVAASHGIEVVGPPPA